MTLREVDGPAGPPWEPELAGTFECLVVESDVLEDNPLGDPARRPLYVYSAPGADGAPAIYLLQGYGGQLDTWLTRREFEPKLIERLDRMFAAGECPPAVVAFVDAWTSIGGSQFLNSPATGRYMDYLCDEVVPFVDGRYGTGRRAVAGHSSGGYGAMVTTMLRPDRFDAFASLAGDALFEVCYTREFPVAARILRDRFESSIEVFLEQVAAADRFDWSVYGALMSVYAMAAAYSRSGEVLLPFDIRTGRVIDAVWARWLELDPVRMAAGHGDELRSMRRIYLDAGRGDEFFLDLGAQAFAAELDGLGARYTLDLFDGGHGGSSYRYPGVIRELVIALGDT